DPLQDPVLAAVDERDRRPREGRVRGAVPKHPDEQHARGLVAVDLARVDRAEEHEEEQREAEDEEGGLAAPPEDELLEAELMQEQLHAGSGSSSSTSAR